MRTVSQRLTPSGRKGFALIIALVLMGFMVVLLLTLGSMTQVQTQVAAVETQQEQARKNAMAGLKAALARLEDLALEDTVVTAPASMFVGSGTASGSGLPSNVNGANQHWVGVWDSSEEQWKPQNPNSRSFKGWLVSRNNFSNVNEVGVAPDANKRKVTMLTAGIGGGATVGDVEVETVALDGAGLNTFAFWIADESLKASIGMADTWSREGENSRPIAAELRRTVSRKTNPKLIAELKGGTFTDENWEKIVSKLQNFSDLGISNTTGIGNDLWQTVTESKRHDLTLNSIGLATNSRKGGWKKDLSRAFNNDLKSNGEPDLSSPFFQANYAGKRVFDKEHFASYNSTGKDFYGPRWEALRSFHEHWGLNKIQNNSNINFRNTGPSIRVYPFEDNNNLAYINAISPGDGNDSSTYNLRWMMTATESATPVAAGKQREDWLDYLGSFTEFQKPIKIGGDERFEFINSPINPVVASVDMLYRIQSYYHTQGANPTWSDPESGWRLRFGYLPVIMLWNPYNVPLRVSGNAFHYRFQHGPELRLMTSGGSTIKLKVHYSDGGTHKTVTRNTFTLPQLFNRHEIAILLPTTIELQPGEIKVFSLTKSERANTTNATVVLPDGSTETRPVAHYITRALENRWEDPASQPSWHYFDAMLFDPDKTFSAGENLQVEVSIPAVNKAGSNPSGAQGGRISSSEARWLYRNEYIYYNVSDNPTFRRSLTVGNSDVVDLAVARTYLLPANEFPSGARMFGQYNPAAPFLGYQSGRGTKNPILGLKIENPGGRWPGPDTDGGNPMRGYWGQSKQASGKTHVVIYDVPRAPLTSLAQLQNASISQYDWQPAYAIGNSFVPPDMSRTSIISYDNNKKRTMIDYSWMLNQRLWDDYFFSSIVEGRTIAPSSGETPEIVLDEEYLTSGKPLPNNRYQLNLLKNDINDLRDFETGASQLLINGAFNVNSTSKEAWKTVLASLSSEAISYRNESGSNATATPENPFYRHGSPKRPFANDSNRWIAGWTDVPDEKITVLAEKIVDEIKKRGPAMGLADFVNRRLSNDNTGEMGTLQAAIEAANINGFEALAPGSLSQADILSAIGPFITTRGDTFLIRAYGSVALPGRTGTSDKPESEAWVEAVVRRIPDSNDQTKRRLTIDSVRWLNKDER